MDVATLFPTYHQISKMGDTTLKFKCEVESVTKWLERTYHYHRSYDPLSEYWMSTGSYLLDKHRWILTRLEDIENNGHSSQDLDWLIRHYKGLWRTNLRGRLPKTNRERCARAFGYVPKKLTPAERKAMYEKKATRGQMAALKHKYMKAYVEDLSKTSSIVRQQTFRHRMLIDQLGRENWYGVYNTLTVDDWHYEKVWGNNVVHANMWRRYTKRITDAVARAMMLKPGSFKTSDIHRYFGCVESGDHTGRLHIHVIHFLKELPHGASDPNFGRDTPNYKEIGIFKTYWSVGFSSPQAVRYNRTDSYAKRGWRWPVERVGTNPKIWRPIRSSTPAAIAGYIAKYLSKDLAANYIAKERDGWMFRVKTTKGLGLDPYKALVSQLSLGQLRKVCMQPTVASILTIQGESFPVHILVKLAAQEWISRMMKSMKQSVYSALYTLRPQGNIIVQYSKTLDRAIMESRISSDEVNIGPIVTETLTRMDISDGQLFEGQYLAKKVQIKIDKIFGPKC